jgi:hypothetical protein
LIAYKAFGQLTSRQKDIQGKMTKSEISSIKAQSLLIFKSISFHPTIHQKIGIQQRNEAVHYLLTKRAKIRVFDKSSELTTFWPKLVLKVLYIFSSIQG